MRVGQQDPSTLWETIKTGAEVAGPWGALTGVALVVWRIVSAAFDSASEMRQRAYIDELSRLEAERARMSAERAEWSAERAALVAEIHALRGDAD